MMKTTLAFPRFARTLFVWLAITVALAIANDAPKTKPEYRTDVIFFESEKFTDVRDGNFGGDKGRENVLEQLKTYLQQRAQSYVPEGKKLMVTITDVDLAGDFEPWHGSAMQDVRIVKAIYPPRIELSFKLIGANGEMEKAGTRQLRDLAFQQTAAASPMNDPFRYEKALLDDWLRAEFRVPKKS